VILQPRTPDIGETAPEAIEEKPVRLRRGLDAEDGYLSCRLPGPLE
jgi:hypothetical protein